MGDAGVAVLGIARPGALADLDADAGVTRVGAREVAVAEAAVGCVAAAVGDEFEVAHGGCGRGGRAGAGSDGAGRDGVLEVERRWVRR